MGLERFEDIEAWHLAPELTCKAHGPTKKAEFARDFFINRGPLRKFNWVNSEPVDTY